MVLWVTCKIYFEYHVGEVFVGLSAFPSSIPVGDEETLHDTSLVCQPLF